jgi:hypothetical protein
MSRERADKTSALPRWPRSNKPEAVSERQQRLRRLPHWHPRYDYVFAWPVPAENLARFQECLSGHLVLPVGVVGPLPLDLGVYRLIPEGGELQDEGRVEDNSTTPTGSAGCRSQQTAGKAGTSLPKAGWLPMASKR